jgi:hypothetical protein
MENVEANIHTVKYMLKLFQILLLFKIIINVLEKRNKYYYINSIFKSLNVFKLKLIIEAKI